MPVFTGTLFIDVSTLPYDAAGFVQVLFLTGVYMTVLSWASRCVFSACELLLCVPEYAYVVGSLILPVIGALPEALLILYAGLGANPSDTLCIGAGVLAGSSVMLLTIPWFLCVFGARVSIDAITGKPRYSIPKLLPYEETNMQYNLFETGVPISAFVRYASGIMLLSTVPYLVLDIPLLFFNSFVVKEVGDHTFIAFLVCLVLCVGYLLLAHRDAMNNVTGSVLDKTSELVGESIVDNRLSLFALIYAELKASGIVFPDSSPIQSTPRRSWSYRLRSVCDPRSTTELTPLQQHSTTSTPSSTPSSSSSRRRPPRAPPTLQYTSLLSYNNVPTTALLRLERVLLPIFNKYDPDHSQVLDMMDIQAMVRDLGERDLMRAKLLQEFYESSPVS
jgi:hypothetical protein